MRDALEGLLRDLTLVTLMLAIALGWALFQVGEGVAELVSNLLIDWPRSSDALSAIPYTQPLTWIVGGRVITLGPLLEGAIEFVVVLAVAVFIHSRTRRETSDIANPS
jgi:hypothetical protein